MKTVRHSFDTIISNEAEDFNLPVGRGSGLSFNALVNVFWTQNLKN